MSKVYHYSEVEWKHKSREGKPFCPKCDAEPKWVKELRRYPGDPPTEMYVDYECKVCGENFTVNWS